MKKFVVFLLVILSLASTALCEGIDLSSMSLEELIALRENLNEEISDRFVPDRMAFYNGKFIVGIDIKEGIYLFVNDAESGFFSITIDDSSNGTHSTADVWANEPYYLKLEKEMHIKAYNITSAHLEVIESPEWAP